MEEEDVDQELEEVDTGPNEIEMENLPEIEKTEEEIPVEPKQLDEQIISGCISMLARTSDGLNYAYNQLYCTQKALTDVAILSRYVYLRYVDLSNNAITDLSPLNSLTDIITLNCSNNRIMEMPDISLPYLKTFNLSNNLIKTLRLISFPELETLILNGNKLTHLFDSNNETTLRSELLPTLNTLELRGNLLVNTDGLQDLTDLRNLYLAKNKIETITNLENLRMLTLLHLRDNEIANLDGFPDELQNLQYLNLRANKIDTMVEVRKLKHLSFLRALILAGNHVADADEYRLETLIVVRKLIRLDKDNFLDEERAEAEKIYEERMKEEMLRTNKDNSDDIDDQEE